MGISLQRLLRPSLPRRLAALVVALAACIYGFYDAMQPAKTAYRPLPHFDKVVHAGAFFGITVLVCYGLLAAECLRARREGHKGCVSKVSLLLIWLAMTTVGALIELVQLWSALGRVADVWDGVANGFGSLLACVLFFGLETVQTRRLAPNEPPATNL